MIGLKKLKFKKREKENKQTEEERKQGWGKENYIELQKPNVEAKVYNNNRKCD